MLSDEYKELYKNYYTDEVDRKRDLTAIESMGHIRRLIGDSKFASIVDVGAGQGAMIELLHNEGRAQKLTALEISESGLAKIQVRKLPNVTAMQFDGYKIAFPDKNFDLAVSFHVLEHVEHERLYLRELGRVSRQAIIEVPLELTSNVGEVMKVTGPYGHINFYQRATFENLLKTTGFKIQKMMVNTVTLEMDMFMSGSTKGRIKNCIRRAALHISPTMASRRFVYLCTALVDCP